MLVIRFLDSPSSAGAKLALATAIAEWTHRLQSPILRAIPAIDAGSPAGTVGFRAGSSPPRLRASASPRVEYEQVPALVTLLLLAGILTSGALVAFFPLPEMQSWLAALSGRTSASSFYEVAALVPWLVLASALFVAAIGTAVLRRPNA
jgi:hypothetical protein